MPGGIKYGFEQDNDGVLGSVEDAGRPDARTFSGTPRKLAQRRGAENFDYRVQAITVVLTHNPTRQRQRQWLCHGHRGVKLWLPII